MKKRFGFFILILLCSCHWQPKIKIISKWADGNNYEVYTYDCRTDTAIYLSELFYDNGHQEDIMFTTKRMDYGDGGMRMEIKKMKQHLSKVFM
jgi:hypothetical protein